MDTITGTIIIMVTTIIITSLARMVCVPHAAMRTAPTPDMVQGEITLGRAISIILAVGLRPCTGALVVSGVCPVPGHDRGRGASTLAMAVGTGITVSLLAALAVGAKDLAVRLFGEGSPMAIRVHRSIEIFGAAIVFLLGITLLIAALGWG